MKDFDKELNRMKRISMIVFRVTTALGLGLIAFIILVIILFMRFFGVM